MAASVAGCLVLLAATCMPLLPPPPPLADSAAFSSTLCRSTTSVLPSCLSPVAYFMSTDWTCVLLPEVERRQRSETACSARQGVRLQVAAGTASSGEHAVGRMAPVAAWLQLPARIWCSIVSPGQWAELLPLLPVLLQFWACLDVSAVLHASRRLAGHWTVPGWW